jgi:hypothetical protein
MDLIDRNIVCLTNDIKGNNIAIDPVRIMLNEQPLIPIPDTDKNAPFIMQFVKSKVSITVINNTFQVTNNTDPDVLSVKFEELLQKVLETLKERTIKAYGFNFVFRSLRKSNINSLLAVNSLSKINKDSLINQISFTFPIDYALMQIQIQDVKDSFLFSINVHFEEMTTFLDLSKTIVEKYNKSLNDARRLAEEVFTIDQ